MRETALTLHSRMTATTSSSGEPQHAQARACKLHTVANAHALCTCSGLLTC